MEIAVGALERGAQTLGIHGCHAKAKDEDDEECGDGVENHMDATPHRTSGAEVAPCQEGDGEGEENCYAGESGCFLGYYLLGLYATVHCTMSDSVLIVKIQHPGTTYGNARVWAATINSKCLR
jgi:hypothetical protein